MNFKTEPHHNTPEKENETEIPQDHTAQEHAWWESVKYSDEPRESER